MKNVALGFIAAATILFVSQVTAVDFVSNVQREAKKQEPVNHHVHRRSAESSEEEEEKSPFSSIGKAFDYVKDSVKGAYHNVTNSDTAAKVSEQLGKFKDGIKETGKKVKAAVHDYTAPSTDQEPTQEQQPEKHS